MSSLWVPSRTVDVFGALHTVAASGAATTVDASDSDTWDVTLTANCTLSLTGFVSGQARYVTLLLRQDGTGSRTVTWPTITWLGTGLAPILQTAPNAVDAVVLLSRDGGTTVYGVAQTSASGLASGTSFPGSPSDGALFYRTDTRILYEYHASMTRWLSVDRKFIPFDVGTHTQNTAPTAAAAGYLPIFEDIYVEKFQCVTRVTTDNSGSSGSHYYTVTLNKIAAPATNTSLGSFPTSGDTANSYTLHTVSVDAVLAAASYISFSVGLAKTGTPGFIICQPVLVVRSAG